MKLTWNREPIQLSINWDLKIQTKKSLLLYIIGLPKREYKLGLKISFATKRRVPKLLILLAAVNVIVK